MKLVFDHIDFTIVGHLRGLLEEQGIHTEIRNEGGSGAAGELPFTQVYPELWILDNRDEVRARTIIREFRESAATPPGPDWTCPSCHESVDGYFSECWNCGGTPAGND
jgi:hypothetical protein